MVLHILLTVLKVIGIILLCILALLLLVLISPIRYKIRITYGGEVHIKGKVSYLLKLIRARIRVPDEDTVKVKVLFFTVYPRKNDKKKKETDGTDSTKQDKAKENPKKNKAEENKAGNGQEDGTSKTGLGAEHASEETLSEAEIPKEPETEQKAENTSKVPSDPSEYMKAQKEENADPEDLPDTPAERLAYTIERICDKIDSVARALDKTEDFLELKSTKQFLEVTKKASLHMLKSMKPSIKGKAILGFEDPSLTGKICAVYGVLYPYHRGEFQLDARFEEEIADVDVTVKGRIILMVFLVQGLRILIFGHAMKVMKNFKILQKIWRIK